MLIEQQVWKQVTENLPAVLNECKHISSFLCSQLLLGRIMISHSDLHSDALKVRNSC